MLYRSVWFQTKEELINISRRYILDVHALTGQRPDLMKTCDIKFANT